MLDRLAGALFEDRDPAALLHTSLSQELVVGHHSARLRIDLPFAERGDVSLKKIGLELVVRVDGQKRTIMLPAGLAGFHPSEAKLDGGTLQVTFEGPDG
jgi:arsenite-transporting ATPase